MVVYDANGLHEGVANSGADKGEPSFLEILTHIILIGELPDIRIETAALFLK
ncbi:MAG: hypothetical protein JWM92_141 [Candidatus Nomurabacteria bacterium]|jgi:hypothetical protein|nr:hypothetical protein [Candidatus Nomurabacteria bacterium]